MQVFRQSSCKWPVLHLHRQRARAPEQHRPEVEAAGREEEWLRERFYNLQAFVNKYKNHQRHKATGLYYWNDDTAIGVDRIPLALSQNKSALSSMPS